MDAKRAKEDGDAAPANLDKEHQYLVRVFQPAQAPSTKLSIATVSDYLEAEVLQIAQRSPAKGLEEGIFFLASGWRRSEEGGVVPTTWAGIKPLQEAALTTALAQFLAASSEAKVRAILGLLDGVVPPRLMNELLVAAAEDSSVPPRVVMDLARPLRGRNLSDLKGHQFSKLVRVLKSSKVYPAVFVTAPCFEEIWRPTFEPKLVLRNRKREVIFKQLPGNALQMGSLLGWILSPTALDSALMPPSQAHLSEAGSREWTGLQRATRQRIETAQRGTQMKVAGAQAQATELVDTFIRAGDGPRLAVLEWLGVFLSSAEPRGKQGYVAPEGFNFWPQQGHHVVDVLGHEQTTPFDKSLKNMLLVQALHSRIYGFPTSGASLNAFMVLLHLSKPIKSEHAASLSPYFPLRTDVPEILGAFQKEARFGEREQVDMATDVAKNDAGYNAAPTDRSLFKSEVFWLTVKGIGTLFLPVAKEAFHCFQGVASAFYNKDPENFETGWREFLLAEAALREPSLLEHLGHVVDLTFRFLQHVAAGGQQETLPPPLPGPAWHALPSTVLENVLDVCDLYRDRQKQGNGIPMGLFSHIDPDPILTTLCIVMASDHHVRDPSLRGRAVKLLHRLCFAFPLWQEKLNQPPLLKHFIPCLVGVFIAVEKAIMSYYDLAYRYKYELRVPVMDLFDLCLQHQEHRKVLAEFSSGAGNDRFLKLLTQLINDSNSQIEEAMRTLMEFHTQQAQEARQPAARQPAAAPASSSGGGGQQHDEEVLDDDQTEGGEDVYRRSRMNYKEQAKKYFSLASKTWKQVWLLCKHCAQVIVDGKTILEQLIHSSLDAQLHYLVGPEMKKVKASEAEYDELNFNPKDIVRQIAEIFLFLARANRSEVVRIVGKDERFYSNDTFSRAVRFTRKYALLSAQDADDFDSFVKELADQVSQQRAAFDEADIPEKYLCEMMADIMSEPVMFPQSRKVVDRSNAERQIMGKDLDPYSNTPVTVDQLIPLPELKEEIHKFAKDKSIALEGGNMFD